MGIVILVFKAFVDVLSLSAALGLDFLVIRGGLSLEPLVQNKVSLIHLLSEHHEGDHA